MYGDVPTSSLQDYDIPQQDKNMLLKYSEKALAHARYEIMEDRDPCYGDVPELAGVRATGPTLEECRKNPADVSEGGIIIRLKRGLPIPPIDKLYDR